VVNFGTRIKEIREMSSPALERLRAARAKAAAGSLVTESPATETVAPERAAAVAADVKAIAELQAGQINPPGEACEPPPDPKAEKAAAKAEAAEAKADAPKRGRGRPPKALPDGSKIDSTQSRADLAQLAGAPAPHADVKLATLYVDCFPVKRTSTELELVEASVLIEAANDIVASELDVPHYSLVDFGKGRGALHVALKHVIAARPAPFNVLLSTRSSQGMDALQALTEAAFAVVRGAA
jgi:hypothetical protein